MTLPISFPLFQARGMVSYALPGTASDLIDQWATVDLNPYEPEFATHDSHRAQYVGRYVNVTFRDQTATDQEGTVVVVSTAREQVDAFKALYPFLAHEVNV